MTRRHAHPRHGLNGGNVLHGARLLGHLRPVGATAHGSVDDARDGAGVDDVIQRSIPVANIFPLFISAPPRATYDKHVHAVTVLTCAFGDFALCLIMGEPQKAVYYDPSKPKAHRGRPDRSRDPVGQRVGDCWLAG